MGPPVVADPEMSAVPLTDRLACGEVEPMPKRVVVAKRKSSVKVLKLSDTMPKARSLPKVVEA